MNTLTQDQLAAFLAEARRSGVYEMYYTELATGLRRGELLGLKWGDIDFKDNLIRIRRQVARIDGNVVEAPLKTKNAYRCVAITQDVADMVRTSNQIHSALPRGVASGFPARMDCLRQCVPASDIRPSAHSRRRYRSPSPERSYVRDRACRKRAFWLRLCDSRCSLSFPA